MSINEKLAKIAELLKTGDRAEAAEIADAMIICSAAEQGGGFSGLKVLEHTGTARLIRVQNYICEPQYSSLAFFEKKEDALDYVNADPVRFTPYQGDALSGGSTQRGQLEDVMKKLTQAVFEGLPAEYRWAAVDADGDVYAYIYRPSPMTMNWIVGAGDLMAMGGDFDASKWQDSLIERKDQAVKKILCHHDIDDAIEDLQHLENNLIDEHLGADTLPDVVQLLKSLDAEIKQKCKKIAQLEMIIVSQPDRLNTTIRKQAAEIATLKVEYENILHSDVKLLKNQELARKKVIYQLFAKGSSTISASFQMSSKTVYGSREAAEQAIPVFVERCLDTNYIDCADADYPIRVKIMELNLEGV